MCRILRYWSKLDDAIRSAAYRGVNVRMLISQWKHSKPQMRPFLRSLLDINEALPKRHNFTGSIQVVSTVFSSNTLQNRRFFWEGSPAIFKPRHLFIYVCSAFIVLLLEINKKSVLRLLHQYMSGSAKAVIIFNVLRRYDLLAAKEEMRIRIFKFFTSLRHSF